MSTSTWKCGGSDLCECGDDPCVLTGLISPDVCPTGSQQEDVDWQLVPDEVPEAHAEPEPGLSLVCTECCFKCKLTTAAKSAGATRCPLKSDSGACSWHFVQPDDVPEADRDEREHAACKACDYKCETSYSKVAGSYTLPPDLCHQGTSGDSQWKVIVPDDVPKAHAEATARETDGGFGCGGPPASDWVELVKLTYLFTAKAADVLKDDDEKKARAEALHDILIADIQKHVDAIGRVLEDEATARETDGELTRTQRITQQARLLGEVIFPHAESGVDDFAEGILMLLESFMQGRAAEETAPETDGEALALWKPSRRLREAAMCLARAIYYPPSDNSPAAITEHLIQCFHALEIQRHDGEPKIQSREPPEATARETDGVPSPEACAAHAYTLGLRVFPLSPDQSRLFATEFMEAVTAVIRSYPHD